MKPGTEWCVRCFKGPDEPAGEGCKRPLWHYRHICEALEGETVCRWCGQTIVLRGRTDDAVHG